MPKSAAYARIERDVLAMARAVPEGHVSTFASLGGHIDVMPRHVAYILATLPDGKRDVVPWHRIVAERGKLHGANPAKAAEQIARLAEEGCTVLRGTLVGFSQRFMPAEALDSGVPRQRRPADAPTSTRTRRR